MAPPGPRRAPGVLAVLLLAAVAGPAGAARVSSSLSTTHHVHHFHNKHGTVPIAINRTPFLTRGGHGKLAAGRLGGGGWLLVPSSRARLSSWGGGRPLPALRLGKRAAGRPLATMVVRTRGGCFLRTRVL